MTVRASRSSGRRAREQRRQAAGVVEILHQEGAGGAEIGGDRHVAGDAVEVVEQELDAGAAGHGDQVDDGVGRAAERHVDDERVLERGAGKDVARLQVLADHLDDAPAAGGRHAAWPESAAGIDEAPGSVSPSVSASAVMVDAVPMVMQVP